MGEVGENGLRERSKGLLARALECSPAEREAFLARECGEDRELRDLVESLLAAHGKAGAFLGGEEEGALEEDRPGATIGRYRLVERIGEGGFGTVYAAEQTAPVKRRVALKVVKLGMDSRSVVARFEAERQALALLDHPGVAKVLDGGATPGGRPYFVMELVPGEPITDYCDRTALTVSERLELLVRVCDAVQHAHHKGIVHRDLKPTNVLVTERDGRPEPKVIDFGIAKATEAGLFGESIVTEAGGILGTPSYMSPEQASGGRLDVDSRADVYSLGCLLYELLAGSLPFEDEVRTPEGRMELLHRIREVDPPRLSARADTAGRRTQATAGARGTTHARLVRQLRGELDWIAARALEKDRERRYPTAASLAEDLGRHLRGEPVDAGPPSALYRLRKWTRRHKLGFAASVAVLLALLGGMGLALAGLRRASYERDLAQDARSEAEKILDFLNDDLLSAVAPDELGKDVGMRQVLDTAAGSIDGRFPDAPRVEAAVRETLGETYRKLGVLDEAERQLIRALAVLMDATPEDDPLRLSVEHALALVYSKQSRAEEARVLGERVMTIRQRVLGSEDPATLSTMNNLSVVLVDLHRFEEAERLLDEVFATRMRLLGEEHPHTLITMNNLGLLYEIWQRFDEALGWRERQLAASRRILGEEHSTTLTARHNMAATLSTVGRREEALEHYRQVVPAKERRLGKAHPSTLGSRIGLANVLLLLGRNAESRAIVEESLERCRAAGYGRELSQYADLLGLAGMHAMSEGRMEDAETLMAEAYEADLAVWGPEHRRTLLSGINLGILYGKVGLHAAALEIGRETRTQLTARHGIDSELSWQASLLVAQALQGLGRFGEAEAELELAVEELEADPGPLARTPARLLDALRSLYAEWGRPERIEPWSSRLTLAED